MQLHTYILISTAGFPDVLGKPVPEFQTILDFAEARDEDTGGDNQNIRTCRAPAKSSAPTYHHSLFTGRKHLAVT